MDIPYAPWCWNIYQHWPELNHPGVISEIYQHHGAYGHVSSGNHIPKSHEPLNHEILVGLVRDSSIGL